MRRVSRTLLFAAAALGLAACGSQPSVTGKVTDIWGKPIEGATVTIESVVEQPTTGAQGTFSMPALEGKKRVRAGAENYIHVEESFVFPAGEDDTVAMPDVHLRLFPEPEGPGLYLVNAAKYSPLAAEGIDTQGTELHAYTGLKEPGDVKTKPGQKLRFVYKAPLEPHQIANLGLELHRLEFVDDTTVSGPMGETNVTINRFIAKDQVAFDLKELATEGSFLIITREALDAGYYAFHTEGALTSTDVDALDKKPEQLRKAYPFQVK